MPADATSISIPPACGDCGECRFHGGSVRHIAREGDCFDAQRAAAFRRLRVTSRIDVETGDARLLLGQSARARPADPAARAGDDDDLSRKARELDAQARIMPCSIIDPSIRL